MEKGKRRPPKLDLTLLKTHESESLVSGAISTPIIDWNSPNSLDPNEGFIYERMLYIRNFLEQNINPEILSRTAILVVGSDGRLENAPDSISLSPMEFCTLGRRDEDFECIEKVIKQGINEDILTDVMPIIERKDLDKVDTDAAYVISGYGGSAKRAYPDRILDAAFLIGNSDLVDKAYQQVFLEWKAVKEVRDALKQNYRNFGKTTLSGISRGKHHFDLETGELFFDKEKNIRGLKYGPIRLMQSILTIRQLVKQQADGVLPSNTIQKLQTLYPDETEVIGCYDQALVFYRQQQHERAIGESGQIKVDPANIQHICKIIHEFAVREYEHFQHDNSKKNNPK